MYVMLASGKGSHGAFIFLIGIIVLVVGIFSDYYTIARGLIAMVLVWLAGALIYYDIYGSFKKKEGGHHGPPAEEE